MTNTDMQTAAPTPKPTHPIMVLREYLEARSSELKAALPPHISETKFIRAVVTACQINPDLLACDKRSMWNACLRACNDGLLPDGVEGAIAPFKGQAQWMPMYQGQLKQFRNSGQFKWVGAGLVREGDEYDHWIDENGEHFKHRPADDNTGKIRRIYAAATTKDGGFFLADMSPADVDKRRKMSRASRSDAPWQTWPEEMMKKTAIRVLSKMLPKSSDRDDLDQFIRRDEEDELGISHDDALAPGVLGRSALDYFADDNKEQQKPSSASPGSSGTETGDAGSGGQAASEGVVSSRSPAPAEAGAAPDPAIATAYERGKQAKADGLSSKAIPGEYRDTARTREALAWQAGFSGNPMPTFKD
jgi:recombination protein RecT